MPNVIIQDIFTIGVMDLAWMDIHVLSSKQYRAWLVCMDGNKLIQL